MTIIVAAARRSLTLLAAMLFALLPLIAVALIAGGAWFIYRPLTPIVVGAFILLDLYRKGPKT